MVERVELLLELLHFSTTARFIHSPTSLNLDAIHFVYSDAVLFIGYKSARRGPNASSCLATNSEENIKIILIFLSAYRLIDLF